jgi:hypothetical protein
MVKRQCLKCKAIFNKKSTYDYHINRKTDCSQNNNNNNNNINNINEFAEINTNLPEFAKICQNLPKFTKSIINYENNINDKNMIYYNEQIFESNDITFCCSYCQKKFSTKYTLERHINDICKVKKESDKEKENIFKLLLEKDKENKEIIEKLEKQNKMFEKQNKMLMDKIDKLINLNSKKSNVNTNTNTNTNSNNTLTNSNNIMTNSNNTNNTQNNIMMVNFGKEDLSIIDEKQFIDRIVKKPTVSGVKIPDEVLKIIHFNPLYPQMSNIYISDINREKCMVFEDGEWKLSNVDNIPQIMDKVCIFSAEQISNLRTKNPNNKPLQDRLGTIEKYNNMIDIDYVDDLRDNDMDRKAEITRCEDFQKYTYNTIKKTLYNEGKKIKKNK